MSRGGVATLAGCTCGARIGRVTCCSHVVCLLDLSPPPESEGSGRQSARDPPGGATWRTLPRTLVRPPGAGAASLASGWATPASGVAASRGGPGAAGASVRPTPVAIRFAMAAIRLARCWMPLSRGPTWRLSALRRRVGGGCCAAGCGHDGALHTAQGSHLARGHWSPWASSALQPWMKAQRRHPRWLHAASASDLRLGLGHACPPPGGGAGRAPDR